MTSGDADHDALRVGRAVFEKAEFEADRDDAATPGVAGVMAAQSAEAAHAEMAVAGQFKARGEEATVELECSAQLNLEAELSDGGRKGLLLEYPAAKAGKVVE